MRQTTRTARKPAPTPARPKSASVESHPALEAGNVDSEETLVARHIALLADPRLGTPTSGQRTRLLQRLQLGYGNAYVADVVQRATAVAEAPPAAAPKPKLDPHQDPRFLAVEHKLRDSGQHEKQHPTAKSRVAEAQAAAVGPPNEVASQAAAGQVDKMAQQKPGDFDKKAFIDAVKQAIEAAAPKNLEQADEFKKSGKAAQVKGQVAGLVGKGKQDSEAAIKQANTEPPDASTAKPKPVTPMGDEKAGPAPADVGAASAMPSPRTAAETSMAAGPADINHDMAQADVTEEQLKKSNEPQFNDALNAKKTAEVNSVQAPQEYAANESQVLGKAGADARGAAGAALGSMHADRAGILAAVSGGKTGAKTQDESKRAEVANKIETIFTQTRTDVTGILDGLDAKVNSAFDAGEKDARAAFETYVDQRMQAYKDKRYSGVLGWERWLEDKFLDMPSEVNAFYVDGRAQYLKQMEGVINRVADVVGGELGKAKKRIADGRQQVNEYVASQPKQLQQVAQDAAKQIGAKFDQLEGDVNAKQDSLVQTLADKYVAARDSLDERINQLKAENKGLVSKAKDAIGGVIQTIKQLKDMLLNVLQRAAGVIGDIIKDPIKFLGNLVGAIKQGLNQFVGNIATHLKKGLMGWLFGALGGAGLQLPDNFDLKGILSMVLQVLGLTYQNVRGIAVKLVGEKVVSAVEGTIKFFTTLATEGPAALWQWIKDKIDSLNIKDVVIGAIKDFVITKIITAGVTWLISMLNPAGAFVRACKMIYDVVMFFIERGSQIMEFVNSILDSISAIVGGSIGAAASLVEGSLAKVLPLAISFLADLLGIGGIAEKIKEIIEKIRAPITKLITAVIGPILRPLKALYEKGEKFVKGVIDKGKALGKKALGKVSGLFGKKKGTETVPFNAAGEGHRVWLDATGPRPKLMVASETRMLESLLNSLDSRTSELGDPAKEAQAKDLIAQARPLGATAMSQVQADKDGTVGPEVAKPQLEQLATILARLFNTFGTHPGGRQVDWDPAQVKDVLGNLTASVEAAKQAKGSRDMTMAAYATLSDEEKQYVSLGTLGVAVGVYLDSGNTAHVVAGINDIGIGGGVDAEKELGAYRKAIQALRDQLSARRITEIVGGNITTGLTKKAKGQAMHEEVLIRNYLRDKGVLGGTVIPIGVSQDSVCGRCVHDLASGGTLSVPGGPPANVSAGAVKEGPVVDPKTMQSVLVAGQNLYHILH